MSKKLFYITPELTPFSDTYIMSQISKKIAISFQNNEDYEIRLMHPKYGFISERKYILREVIRLKDFPIIFNNEEKLVSIKSAFIPETRAQIYFVEDEKYFKPISELLYKSRNGRIIKNIDEKFALLTKISLETLKQLLWIPDIIICCDWQISLLPQLYQKEYKKDKFFKNIKTVFILNSINEYRFFSNKSYNSIGLNNNKNCSITNAIENADITICLNHNNQLSDLLPKNKLINNALKKHNHLFIDIPKSPSFSEWKDIINSFEKELNNI